MRIGGFAAIALVLVLGCAHTPKASSEPGTGVIAGRVTDENGAPAQCNVNIRDMVGKPLGGAETGADGKYLVARVPVGFCSVLAYGVGFGSQERDSVYVSAGDTTFVSFKLPLRFNFPLRRKILSDDSHRGGKP